MDKVVYVKVFFESQKEPCQYIFSGELEEIERIFSSALKHRSVLTLAVGKSGKTVLDMSKVLRFLITTDRYDFRTGLPTAREDKPTLTAGSISVLSR
ncbi:hypothetical protein E4U03_09575 [Rothia nasimurium]|uniref:Uncharacterized protein n=1 Tax=Rothia nasimurium TaxID=85336 RepID=A0A4Y9F2T6_9MICC|nr:hypothetical protein [Rothia nasimurium]MBF0808849.1 hypothetical protein [Rothia nasimurium]TFU21204.1 hypothetical protein E4U03_09575 [Rothia nasimurium]